jgi:hypothetical protein
MTLAPTKTLLDHVEAEEEILLDLWNQFTTLAPLVGQFRRCEFREQPELAGNDDKVIKAETVTRVTQSQQ